MKFKYSYKAYPSLPGSLPLAASPVPVPVASPAVAYAPAASHPVPAYGAGHLRSYPSDLTASMSGYPGHDHFVAAASSANEVVPKYYGPRFHSYYDMSSMPSYYEKHKKYIENLLHPAGSDVVYDHEMSPGHDHDPLAVMMKFKDPELEVKKMVAASHHHPQSKRFFLRYPNYNFI